ncbi:MAG: hypothetical protein NZ533_09615 [Casimicrobiaceae bacterium]|nr:hypothetical protein [Casimicrobiaceae bacterium]MCX8097700.1 hypothetical protein [Casimicrobiaceae bacterium]
MLEVVPCGFEFFDDRPLIGQAMTPQLTVEKAPHRPRSEGASPAEPALAVKARLSVDDLRKLVFRLHVHLGQRLRAAQDAGILLCIRRVKVARMKGTILTRAQKNAPKTLCRSPGRRLRSLG